MDNYVLLGLLVVMIVMMIVLPMITQKKRIKEFNDMVDSLKASDEIRTIGGIVGRIVKICDKEYGKTIILETGDKGSKSVLEFDVAAVGLVLKQSSKKEKTVEQKAEEVVNEEPKQETIVEEKTEAKTTKKSTKKSTKK